jgi:hypothetical protein
MTAMDITIHASFLPHNDPDASLAFYRDRPEVVPVVLLLLRAGARLRRTANAKSPSGAIGLSISGLPVRL